MSEPKSARAGPLFAFPRERMVLAAFSLIACLILAFGWIGEEVVEGNAVGFDARVFAWFGHGPHGEGVSGSLRLQEFARDVTALGSYAVLGYLSLAAVLYLLLIRRYRHAALTLIALAGGSGLSHLLKWLFHRPRPTFDGTVHVFSKSFPSGHAMLSTIAFLTLASLLAPVLPDRKTRMFVVVQAIVLAVAVGISRIFLGVHYPSDVLAGWCVGGAWACAWIGIARKLAPRG